MTGTVDIASVRTARSEMFYWITIMFSQTLGTALGDYVASEDGLDLGYLISAAVFGGAMVILVCCITDQGVANNPVLDRVYPDPAARRRCRRFSRQADCGRRPCIKSIYRYGDIARFDSRWQLLSSHRDRQRRHISVFYFRAANVRDAFVFWPTFLRGTARCLQL